jgi:hypothetical protein
VTPIAVRLTGSTEMIATGSKIRSELLRRENPVS